MPVYLTYCIMVPRLDQNHARMTSDHSYYTYADALNNLSHYLLKYRRGLLRIIVFFQLKKTITVLMNEHISA